MQSLKTVILFISKSQVGYYSMNKQNLLLKLKSLKHKLKDDFGIEEFALFGSYARGDAKEDSDVDLTILKMRKKDFFKRAKAIYFLEEQLNKKIDMGYFDSIRKVLKDDIRKEMIYV